MEPGTSDALERLEMRQASKQQYNNLYGVQGAAVSNGYVQQIQLQPAVRAILVVTNALKDGISLAELERAVATMKQHLEA